MHIEHERPGKKYCVCRGLSREGLFGVLLIALALMFGDTVVDAAAAVPADANGVTLVSADATGIVLDVALDPYALEVSNAPDGQAYVQVNLAGFERSGSPGRPVLPSRSFLFAAPPGARLQITTTVLAEQNHTLPAPVYPAPTWVYDDVFDGGVREVFTRDAAAYANPAAAPAELVALEDAGVMRGVRLLRLTLQPIQYRAASQTLRFVSGMRVEVQFVDAPAPQTPSVPPDMSGFVDLLRQTVINPDYVTAWRAAVPALSAAAPSSVGLPLDRTRYRIRLQESGIYQLTYTDLANAGVPLTSLVPVRLSVYQGDQELAIEVVGEADGRFDPDDVVRFYAERVQSLYTEVNTLWLVVGDGPGRRMMTRSAPPAEGAVPAAFSATQHFEVNRVYRSAMPMASDVDHWYWGQMFAVGAARSLTLTLSFTLTNPLPAGSAVLTTELWGASSDARVALDHHVRVYINGAAIGDIRWDGAVRMLAQLPFDQALLQPGNNTLTLYTPADTGARDSFNRLWEVNWLNFFRLTYERSFALTDEQLAFTSAPGPARFAVTGWAAPKSLAYDVTDPAAPVRLEGGVMIGAPGSYALHMSDSVAPGGRYFVLSPAALKAPLDLAADPASGLRSTIEGADYLIIAHADFVAGVQPLAAHRRSQGLRVRVIDVQDIYDEFSGGLFTPHAIRAFIAYAYFNWPAPAPSYVVLVGDGTYDFMDREGYGAKTYIPPFLAAVDPLMGETAADNRYVAVDGNDILPDLHLGRFPVNNQAELTAMVSKIVSYESMPESGPWRTKGVFVADNPDAAGQFGALSDTTAAYLPPEFEIKRIYLGSADYPVSDAVKAQQATLDAFNAGALLFNFVGHSSVTNWAAELLFGINVLPQVNNGGRLPIVLPMTCLEGTYHNPRYAGLSESVVRLAGRGAIASWAPTGQGVASGHDFMHRGFYDALFSWDVRVLGDAATAGLLYLYTNARFPDGTPRFRDLVDTYVLLGDPATQIGVAPANLSLTASGAPGPLRAGDPVTYTVNYNNTGSVRVKGVEIAISLSGALTGMAWHSPESGLTKRPGAPLVWDLPELAPGASGQLTVTGQVAAQQPITSPALVAEMRIGSRWTETDLADNYSGRLVTDLVPADLLLNQIVEPAAPVTMGDLVTFTLSYANLGQAAAPGVSLTLPLPVPLDDLRVLRAGPAATLRPGSHYVWDIATIQPGEKGRLTVIGRIPHTLTWAQIHWSVAARIEVAWPDADLNNNVGASGNIIVDVGDAFEPDDTPAQATRFAPSTVVQPHAYDTVGDQDWVVFRAQAGMRYLIRTLNLGADGDTVIFLRDETGVLLAKNDDATPDTRASLILWHAPVEQDYYIMMTSNNPTAGFSYQLQVSEMPYSIALPLIRNAR